MLWSWKHRVRKGAPVEGADERAGDAGALQRGQPLAHAGPRLAERVEALRVYGRHAPGQPLRAAPLARPLQHLRRAATPHELT